MQRPAIDTCTRAVEVLTGLIQGGVGRILACADGKLVISLHRHDTNDGQLCTETGTGLDHVGFAVPAREDLEEWQGHLEAHGLVRSDTPTNR